MSSQNLIETDRFGLTKRDWDTIINIIKKYPTIKQVSLFGSRAKGNYKKGSDIDLAFMDKNIENKIIDKLKIDFEESSLPYNVDLVNYHCLDHRELKEHIDRIGTMFYIREKK